MTSRTDAKSLSGQTAPGVEVAPFRPAEAAQGFAWIYGLSIISCYLVNLWVTANPIGPWRGEDIAKSFWLDNVSWQIFSAWWVCFFAVCSFWPFNSISDKIVRGVAVVGVSWILGWWSAKLIFLIGPGADGIFPLVGTTWFLLAFCCFAGGNFLVAKLPPERQFLVHLLLFTGLTYVITHSAIKWVPAWWFPFLLVGLATSTLPYLTRGLAQPGRAVVMISILFACVALCVQISSAAGFWDVTASPISAFWTMGHPTPDNFWLLHDSHVHQLCSANYHAQLAIYKNRNAMGRLAGDRILSRARRCRSQSAGEACWAGILQHGRAAHVCIHGCELVAYHPSRVWYRPATSVSLDGSEDARRLG